MEIMYYRNHVLEALVVVCAGLGSERKRGSTETAVRFVKQIHSFGMAAFGPLDHSPILMGNYCRQKDKSNHTFDVPLLSLSGTFHGMQTISPSL
jgi:hypothetical protein